MKRGDVYPVTNDTHYSLPRGLQDGTLVRLLELDGGFWTVGLGPVERVAQAHRVRENLDGATVAEFANIGG